MSDVKPLNPGLYRVHRIFFIIFTIATVAIGTAGVVAAFKDPSGAIIAAIGIFPATFAVGHWLAARGARLGRTYGRTLSIIFGCLWVIGFPIGTILGIYVFTKVGSSWSPAEQAS